MYVYNVFSVRRGVVEQGDAAELDQGTVVPPSSSAALQVTNLPIQYRIFCICSALIAKMH